MARLEVHPSPWLLKVLHPAEETPESLVFVSERVVGRQNIVPSRLIENCAAGGDAVDSAVEPGGAGARLAGRPARQPQQQHGGPQLRLHPHRLRVPLGALAGTLSHFCQHGSKVSSLLYFALNRAKVSSPSQDWQHGSGLQALVFSPVAVCTFVV